MDAYSDEYYQQPYWKRSAHHYRQYDHPVVEAYTRPRIRTICEVIQPSKDTTLLDAGTGNGIFLVPLNEHFNAYGIDTAQCMLDINPLKHKCLLGDCSEIDVGDRYYDVVFEANTLHHVESPVAFVSELCRVAKRWVVLLEPNRYNPIMAALGILRRAERKSLRFTKPYVRNLIPDHFSVEHISTSGMIAQNRVPAFLLPLLKCFDFRSPLGMFTLLIARRRD